MTEPIYEFVRGTGWVVTNNDSLEFVTRHGRFRVVNRYPNEGDMFVSSDDRNLKEIAKHCIGCNWGVGINAYKNTSLWKREGCVAIEYVGLV